MSIVRIPLHSRKYPGLFVLIDEEDYPLIANYRWFVHHSGRTAYAMCNTQDPDGRRHHPQMHRVIMNAPDGIEVDHIDGNGLNNTRANMRLCTHRDNVRNAVVRKDSKSGYRGVTFHPSGSKWHAYISVDGRIVSIGYYNDPITAGRAYDTRAREVHGDFARLNFPDAEPFVIPAHKCRQFTAAEDAAIVRLREGGKTWQQIGTELNRVAGSVGIRYRRILCKREAGP